MSNYSEPSGQTDLAVSKSIDLAKVELNYERFRELAQNRGLSRDERIGFPDSYRGDHDQAIIADIAAKLPALNGWEQSVLDIGAGCGGLVQSLIALCAERRHTLTLNDSPEMLDQLPDGDGLRKVSGMYPKVAHDLQTASHQGYDAIICYSVLHYMYVDTNLFDVVDSTIALLAPGGRALFGDIPNVSKRKRFFSTAAGRAFHANFTGRDDFEPPVFNVPEPGRIDDAVLLGLIQRAQAAGCDAYLAPQGADLPMANRRDDLLICKP